MRIGKIGLNDFLPFVKRAEPAKCPRDEDGANQTVAHMLMYCRTRHRFREEYLCKEGDTMREIRKMLSASQVLARRATMFMAKRGLLSELIRSFW